MAPLINRVTAQVYVMEICPNRIRGGMEAFSAVWYVFAPPQVSWHTLANQPGKASAASFRAL